MWPGPRRALKSPGRGSSSAARRPSPLQPFPCRSALPAPPDPVPVPAPPEVPGGWRRDGQRGFEGPDTPSQALLTLTRVRSVPLSCPLSELQSWGAFLGIFTAWCLGFGARVPGRSKIAKDKRGHWVTGPETLQDKVIKARTQISESHPSTECPMSRFHKVFGGRWPRRPRRSFHVNSLRFSCSFDFSWGCRVRGQGSPKPAHSHEMYTGNSVLMTTAGRGNVMAPPSPMTS